MRIRRIKRAIIFFYSFFVVVLFRVIYFAEFDQMWRLMSAITAKTLNEIEKES